MAIGTFMSPLDASVVNIALPSISQYFNAAIPTVQWVVLSYLLVISSLLLTYGRLGDMVGHKPVYLTGFVIFTAGSIFCAISPTIGFLIAARGIQALGAGMMMAIGPALVTSAFPPAERGKALGIVGMTVASALAVGPTVGGLLVTSFGWPSIFLINLPIGIAGITLAAKVLKRTETPGGQRFDIWGAITAFLALMSLLLALTRGSTWGWQSPPIVILAAAFLLLLALFIILEQRVNQPMMDLSLFSIRLFSAANASALLNYMAQFSVIFLLPFFLQQVRQLPASRAGLLLTPLPLVVLLVAPVSGTLSDRIGSRTLSSTGMAITTAGLYFLSRLQEGSGDISVIFPLALVGLGSGLFQSPNSSAIMGCVPKNRLGIASGTLASMRNIGMVMGIALSGAVFDSRFAVHTARLITGGLTGEALQARAFVLSLQDAYLVAAMLALIGVLTSVVRGSSSPVQSRN